MGRPRIIDADDDLLHRAPDSSLCRSIEVRRLQQRNDDLQRALTRASADRTDELAALEQALRESQAEARQLTADYLSMQNLVTDMAQRLVNDGGDLVGFEQRLKAHGFEVD